MVYLEVNFQAKMYSLRMHKPKAMKSLVGSLKVSLVIKGNPLYMYTY